VAYESPSSDAWALLNALHWIIVDGLQNVIFEIDCKQVVDEVSHGKIIRSEYGSIIEDCRTILSCQNNFQVVFTR
jgi:hypothetical protein